MDSCGNVRMGVGRRLCALVRLGRVINSKKMVNTEIWTALGISFFFNDVLGIFCCVLEGGGASVSLADPEERRFKSNKSPPV